MKNLLRSMLLVTILFFTGIFDGEATNPPEGFVFANNTQFRIVNTDGTTSPYYFSGTNNYYLMYKPIDMVDNVLDDMAYLGEKVVRMWFFMDGTQDHDGYLLQSAPGVYDEKTMKHIDQVVAEAGKRGLKVLPVFINNWSDFGGMPQYAQWAGANAADFYSNLRCQDIYKNYVSNWLNRVNTVTGVTYKDDPVIFAWELTNEARCTKDNLEDFVKWVNEMSSYIHSIDPNHMIAVGDEGFFDYTYSQVDSINQARSANGLYQITNGWPYAGSMGDWTATLDLPYISYGTLHNYATGSWSQTQEWGENWIKYHIEIANKHNKPCVMEEYDMKVNTPWTVDADQKRADLLKAYTTIIRDYNMAGDMAWMLIGLNTFDPVESGYTLNTSAPVQQLWLYRVKWDDGFQYSRYDTYTGPLMRSHCMDMLGKNKDSLTNLPPVAIGGKDEVVIDSDNTGSETVSFDGSDSYDPDGSIVSYKWSEGSNVFSTSAKATFNLSVGIHTIVFTVTDNDGAIGTKTFTVSVFSGTSKVFEAEDATITGNALIENDDPSASNGQYVYMQANPATIVFDVNDVPVASSYKVTIVTRVPAGFGEKTNNVSSSAGTNISAKFPESGDQWVKNVFNVNLAKGANTITISANWGYMYVDYISIQGTEIISGIKNVKGSKEFVVYPNPASSYVKISDNKSINYQLYNLTGRLIKTGFDTQINVSNLVNGIYVVKTDDNHMAKFVKK